MCIFHNAEYHIIFHNKGYSNRIEWAQETSLWQCGDEIKGFSGVLSGDERSLAVDNVIGEFTT
jgi:hypothetical protein